MDDTARLFATARPELVFHLAAEVGGIGANLANPGRYWYANLMMGAHVLEQSRLHEVRKLVTPGRSASTRSSRRRPSARTTSGTATRRRRTRPYGIAKKAMLVGGQAYRDQYGLNTIHLLPVNLYGPGDNFDPATAHVIPDLIRKMHESPGARWCSSGDGTPTREFLYVDDCVEGIALAASAYDGPEPVNLGTGARSRSATSPS